MISTIFFYRAFGSIIPKTNEFLDIPYPYCDLNELDEYIESKIDALMVKIDSADTPLLSTTSSSSTPFGSPPNLNYNNNPYSNIRFDDDNEHTTSTSMPNSPLINDSHPSLRSPNLIPYSGRNISSAGNSNSNIKYTQVVLNFYELRKLKKPTWFGKIEEEVNFEIWLINIRTIKSINELNNDSFTVDKLQANFEALIWQISDIADNNKDHLPIIPSTETLPFNYSISIKSSGSNDSWKEFIKRMLKDPII